MKLLICFISFKDDSLCVWLGTAQGCALQFDSFRVCPSNQGSELVSPGPSINNPSGEGQNWQRETKPSYTTMLFARIHLAKSSVCFSRLSVCFHVDALDSWTTIHFRSIIHDSAQGKFSLLFNPVSQRCLSQRSRILFLLVGDFICIASRISAWWLISCNWANPLKIRELAEVSLRV